MSEDRPTSELSRRSVVRSITAATGAAAFGATRASASPTLTTEPRAVRDSLRDRGDVLDWLAAEGIDTDTLLGIDRVVEPGELSPKTIGETDGVVRVTSSKIDPTTGGRIELRRTVGDATVDLVTESSFDRGYAMIRRDDTWTVRTATGEVVSHAAPNTDDDDVTTTAEYACLYNGKSACEYFWVYCDFPCSIYPTYDKCYYETCPVDCDQVCSRY